MELWENRLYREDVEAAARLPLDWKKLEGKTILIAGATGMIGSFLTDVLQYRNRCEKMGCRVLALGRSRKRAEDRFRDYRNRQEFCFIEGDVNEELHIEDKQVDYVFHAASNTHPVSYAQDPIRTITTNVTGTDRLLRFAVERGAKRFVFASSVEIYGENTGEYEKFREMDCGYIDCNTLRAGYPESKRAGETLCQAYRKKEGIETVTCRLARTYGPTMLMTDSKAISQFLKKGVSGEDIILKSEGTQFYSYVYTPDAVTGILTCLLEGENGEAYNICGDSSDIRLAKLAAMIADHAGKQVVYEKPEKHEQEGYSRATKALLDNEKLKGLGWKPAYTMEQGIYRTIEILRGRQEG